MTEESNLNQEPQFQKFTLNDVVFNLCAKNLIDHGPTTNTVPETVKDWIYGKLCRSFPHSLRTKLISEMIN